MEKLIYQSTAISFNDLIPLQESFYRRSALVVAKELLGCLLVHKTPKGVIAGIINETEAYLHDDPSSHSFKGKTARNTPMFESGGKSYIYFTYGMHYCFNVVTGVKDVGEAVLLRSIIPVKGIDLMKENREKNKITELANGPAKLVQALSIKPSQNNQDITKGNLFISKYISPKNINNSKRIGISKGKDLLYRFYLTDNIVS